LPMNFESGRCAGRAAAFGATRAGGFAARAFGFGTLATAFFAWTPDFAPDFAPDFGFAFAWEARALGCGFDLRVVAMGYPS